MSNLKRIKQLRAKKLVSNPKGLILPKMNTEIARELGAKVDERLPSGYSHVLVIIPHNSKEQVQVSWSERMKTAGISKILNQVATNLATK